MNPLLYFTLLIAIFPKIIHPRLLTPTNSTLYLPLSNCTFTFSEPSPSSLLFY